MSASDTIRMPSTTILPQPDAAPPENPDYVALQVAIANASAIKVTDKLIIARCIPEFDLYRCGCVTKR